MKTQIASPTLVVLELSGKEQAERERAGELITAALLESRLEPWSSLEIECFTYEGRQLLLARPIKVFVPDFLIRFAEFHGV
ncbi:MAG: hypothetical protein RSD32_03275 [Oscillospiraceae bacterium]